MTTTNLDDGRIGAMLDATGDAVGGKDQVRGPLRAGGGVTQPHVATSDYQQRKLDGRCVYPGCPAICADDSSLCPAHRDAQRRRVRLAVRKKRARWRRAGLCTRCGRKRKPGHGWGCPKCIVAVDAVPRRLVTTHVNKSARIAARTEAVDEHAADGYRRTRYRGQDRRGRQSNQQIDEQDLDDAIERLRRGKAGLALARSAEVQQLPRVQRDEAKHEALAHIDHGLRFAEDVLERNRPRRK